MATENAALRQQLIVISRGRKRAPKLKLTDKLLFGFFAGLINPCRLSKVAILLKPATILKFHRALVKKKYQLLYSNKVKKKPGPKGPSHDLIDVIIEIKRRNPQFGYRRIAMQIFQAFGIDIDKDVVRRILKKHKKRNIPGGNGPSWLTFIGNMKDSLWSIDFFRCESITLKTHWVMLVMDQYTRRIVGIASHVGNLDGVTICCLFNRIISQSKPTLPKYLSSDNDPLFTFHRWQANLRILEISEIKSIPYSPTSHPFVERLIGTIRRECLDHLLFFNSLDLEKKLSDFSCYYNANRGHSAIGKKSPLQKAGLMKHNLVTLKNFQWKSHNQGLFKLPNTA